MTTSAPIEKEYDIPIETPEPQKVEVDWDEVIEKAIEREPVRV